MLFWNTYLYSCVIKTWLTYEYFILTVRSRLKAQTADQIQKWNQSAEAGSPDHKGNQCVRSAGRVLWQQFSQDTCFNKTWINTMDVLHTSWVSFLIKFRSAGNCFQTSRSHSVYSVMTIYLVVGLWGSEQMYFRIWVFLIICLRTFSPKKYLQNFIPFIP